MMTSALRQNLNYASDHNNYLRVLQVDGLQVGEWVLGWAGLTGNKANSVQLWFSWALG